MGYDEFKTYVVGKVAEAFGTAYNVQTFEVRKNNGIIKDGITATCNGKNATPVAFLNDYFDEEMDKGKADKAANQIAAIIREHSGIQKDFSFINDFDAVKDMVIFRLVNTRANSDMLDDVASINMLDLSVVFNLLLVGGGPTGTTTSCKITKRMMERWGTDCNSLMELAMVNTPKLLPARIRHISDMMDEVIQLAAFEGDGPDVSVTQDLTALPDGREPVYVLTNSTGAYGASALLYPDILKEFSDIYSKDIIIMPSSIHETIIIPIDNGTTIKECQELVSSANSVVVGRDEFLSYNVYLYRRDLDKVTIVA